VETAVISHRVADFLKKHPPFNAMDEADLLELSRQGRVRFFEANEYITWQGESYRMQVMVIQQGTVSLWDESGDAPELRDVRGEGDMLGIEQFDGDGVYAYSARSSSDVLIYGFPAIEFEALVLKYPYARRFAAAYGSGSGDLSAADGRRGPHAIFLQDVAVRERLLSCASNVSIREAVGKMRDTGTDSIVVLDSEKRALAVLTSGDFLRWIVEGGGDPRESVSTLVRSAPLAVAPNASVSDVVLAMGSSEDVAVILTADGTAAGRVQAVVTSKDLEPVFGDQPVAILRDIPNAANVQVLRELNKRARSFVLQQLTSAASVEWLARFTSLIDLRIARRVVSLCNVAHLPVTWCFYGSSGRRESLTRVCPQLLLIAEDDRGRDQLLDAFQSVTESFAECGYLPANDSSFERQYLVASAAEWKQRFGNWLRDPVLNEMYRARPLFDSRPIFGTEAPWHEIETAVTGAMNRSFLQILANDCLTSLPPLTFFHDAVVNEIGEESAIFRLDHSAVQPLVDVGRVFGMAANRVVSSSTLERFARARSLLPEHESIFREAAETFRIVLWQQSRIGISQGTDGAELPPALLSRFDRQILKNGFRSILRLLEFTAELKWLQVL